MGNIHEKQLDKPFLRQLYQRLQLPFAKAFCFALSAFAGRNPAFNGLKPFFKKLRHLRQAPLGPQTSSITAAASPGVRTGFLSSSAVISSR
jgi:hypothetical protein